MKSLLSLALAIGLCASHARDMSAQRVAATRSDGTKVWLNADHTWVEAADKPATGSAASVQTRTKPGSATATTPILKMGSLSYDPAKWIPKQGQTAGRLTLAHTSGDGYALVIAERIPMEEDALVNMALTNAQNAAPDAHFVADEKRVVNGIPLRCLQIAGTIQGISFRYFGYYYTGAAGTIQLITYTSSNLFEEYQPDFEDLLDGLVLTP